MSNSGLVPHETHVKFKFSVSAWPYTLELYYDLIILKCVMDCFVILQKINKQYVEADINKFCVEQDFLNWLTLYVIRFEISIWA